ncbi:hypothetical protein B4900_10910 [Yersinia rohdei]|nr:hypothetical protein B4900_10910 [Yersinia rohdei]
MKELDGFTVEQLNDFIKSDHAQCGDVAALARIALAAKRAEPVDEIAFDMARNIMTLVNEINIGGACQLQAKTQYFIEETLATTPQLNSPEIPEGWTSSDPANAALVMLGRIDTIDTADDDRIEDIKLIIRQLAAAPEPQNQQQNIPEIIPQGWINCSDRMPEDDTLCLGVDECGVIWTMHFDDGEFRADTGDVDDLKISHWMPLPDAPEKPL